MSQRLTHTQVQYLVCSVSARVRRLPVGTDRGCLFLSQRRAEADTEWLAHCRCVPSSASQQFACVSTPSIRLNLEKPHYLSQISHRYIPRTHG